MHIIIFNDVNREYNFNNNSFVITFKNYRSRYANVCYDLK